MRKFYVSILALLLGAAASQAAITVTFGENNTPVESGETLQVGADKFTHTYIPGVLDKWVGKIDITVASAAPTEVTLVGTSPDIQFCPVGQNCYTLFPEGDAFKGGGTITNPVVEIPVDMNYFDQGEVLPVEQQNLTATFKDSDGAEFVLHFVFDTSDASVGGVALDATYNVYSIAGYQLVKGGGQEAVKALPAGLYIVNGKKMIIK